MATVEELVRDVLASVDTNVGAPRIARAIQNRYDQFVAQTRPRHLRRVGELLLQGVIDDDGTGTVAATRGSTTITGTDTTFDTEITGSDATHYYFRTSSAWYQIASVASDTELTLTTAFAEDDVTAGSYEIVRRVYALNTSARFLGAVVHTRLRRQLNVVSLAELDMMYPDRVEASSYPRFIAQHSYDATNGYVLVEAYPTPEDSEILHYVYWEAPGTLTMTSTIPETIDAYVLKEGVYIDVCRYEASRAVRAGNVDAAVYWRNESRAQETRWQEYIRDAIRTNRAVDDVSIILSTARNWQHNDKPDVYRTAHDVVYDRTWS